MIETREQLREIEEHFKRATALIDDLGNCDDEGQTMGPGAWMSLGLAKEAAGRRRSAPPFSWHKDKT